MDSHDTQINANVILEAISGLRQEISQAINGLRQEMNQRFNNIEARLINVENRLTNVENDVRQIKEMQFVFENELARLQAIVHQSLNLAHENRADVRIMRKGFSAWSEDVRDLQNQAA